MSRGHDSGRVINPVIVEGQILGGITCGRGNAFLEEHVYSPEGQLLTQSARRMDLSALLARRAGFGHGTETPALAKANSVGIRKV